MFSPGIVAPPPMGFTTRWTVAGDATARTIALPLYDSGTFNCTVDWGDGSPLSLITAFDDPDRMHTYAADGTYQVEIRGECPAWSFNNGGDKLKIVAVVDWGHESLFGGFSYLGYGFQGCTNLVSLGRNKIPASGSGTGDAAFIATFENTRIQRIPHELFYKHSNAGPWNAFVFTFAYCTSLREIPSDLFRFSATALNNTFYGTFYGCTALVSIPDDLFRHLPGLMYEAFYITFYGCTQLASLPPRLFQYNRGGLSVAAFGSTFSGCDKLQVRSDLWYEDGEQATRFLGLPIIFTDCFWRGGFTGVQGVAPDIWNCDFGESIALDVAPAVDWEPGDTITGQSSGATAEVVSKTSLGYKIKKHLGTFTLGEVVGVSGNPDKLAAQGAAHPVFSGSPAISAVFSGAGNSPASLANYSDIPAWCR